MKRLVIESDPSCMIIRHEYEYYNNFHSYGIDLSFKIMFTMLKLHNFYCYIKSCMGIIRLLQIIAIKW